MIIPRLLDLKTKNISDNVKAEAQSIVAKNAQHMLYSVPGGVTNWGVVNIATPTIQQDPNFTSVDQSALICNIVYVAPPANTLLFRRTGETAVFAMSGLQSISDLGLIKDLNEIEFALDQAPLPFELIAILWRF